MTEPVKARSHVSSHLIAAPCADVFAAISDPDRLARWWGPDGFTNTVHEFGFFAGGHWRITMHGPDGQDYPNHYRVLRVAQDRLIEVDHAWADHHFVLTIQLQAQQQHTMLLWCQTFDSAAQYQPLANFLTTANAQLLARLSTEVASGA